MILVLHLVLKLPVLLVVKVIFQRAAHDRLSLYRPCFDEKKKSEFNVSQKLPW